MAKNSNPEENARGQWGNQLEFILTMVSYAVGLGNVWRFPYLTYSNGGGAFLIPYVFALAFLGLPLFYLETALGQYAGLGPTKAWCVSPLFRGCGWTSIIITAVTSIYYNVLISYMLYYFVMSMTSDLPWSKCANGKDSWATQWCTDFSGATNSTQNSTTTPAVPELTTAAVSNATSAIGSACAVSSNQSHLPSEDYFYYNVLKITNGIEDVGTLQWPLVVALFVAWVLVGGVLILYFAQGVQTLGKFVYVTAIFPYIMLTVLLVNNCLQTNAEAGIVFYLKPNFKLLLNFDVWSKAATQIFFSLSVCNGGLIVMSSYNKFKNNIYRDAVMVPIINCCTSVYAGFAIFSALGYMAHMKGVPNDVGSVATSGPELAFVTYPAALATMPVAPLWSILFFLMMLLLGFGSEFSLVEASLTTLIDHYPGLLRRNQVRTITFRITSYLFFFILGLPQVTRSGLYLLTLVNDMIAGWPLLVCGFFEVIAISWVYGLDRFCTDIEKMVGKKPNYYWKATWLVITPAALAVLIVSTIINHIQNPPTYAGYIYSTDCPYHYPWWANMLAWFMLVGPCVPILLCFTQQLTKGIRECRKQGRAEGVFRTFWEGLKIAARPTKSWLSQLEREQLVRAAKMSNAAVNRGFDISYDEYAVKTEAVPSNSFYLAHDIPTISESVKL